MKTNLFSIIKKESSAENDSRQSHQLENLQAPVPDLLNINNELNVIESNNLSNNHIKTSTNTMNLMAKGAAIEGTLMIEGDLTVEGKIVGDIVALGNIMLEDGGLIEGNIKANALTVSSIFKGNAEVSGGCLVSSTESVDGDLVINILNVNAGAQVSGNISMYESQATESSPVKLNNNARLAVPN